MADEERRNYGTTLKVSTIKQLRLLAVMQDRPANTLIEEALEWLFKKYKGKSGGK